MSRIWILFACVVVAFGAIIFRLFYWQILKGDSLRIQAARQYNLDLLLPATRGAIVDATGTPLVINEEAYLVYAQPKEITDIERFAQTISVPLGQDAASISAKLRIPDRVWIPIARKVNAEVRDTLRALELQGLGFELASKRYYPESSMAAQLLGFVAEDQNGNDIGYFGLEGYYDRLLRGRDGAIEVQKDVAGSAILVGDSKRIEPSDGMNLELYVDRSIQHIVEKRLTQGIQKYGAAEGSIVILDPVTGGIYAMASYPASEPKNPIVASSYEPGSTFKVLVMSAAINENAVKAETIMEETGPVQVGEYAIRTWNNEYHGRLSMTEVIQHSSNVGMVFAARRLGEDQFLKYLHAFGIGETTGIDLQEESSPDLRGDGQWRDIDLATASFGQGIAVTPIQMVRAVAAIANGGWLMEPHVVQKITGTGVRNVEIKPKKVRQVVSAKTAHVMTEMMINAVDKGEAKWAKPVGYRIAGKTGTAQIPVSGHYDNTKTIASFVGFAPADNPKFVMLVTLREPSSSPWGSETAAPLFFNIARDLFAYWNIPATQ